MFLIIIWYRGWLSGCTLLSALLPRGSITGFCFGSDGAAEIPPSSFQNSGVDELPRPLGINKGSLRVKRDGGPQDTRVGKIQPLAVMWKVIIISSNLNWCESQTGESITSVCWVSANTISSCASCSGLIFKYQLFPETELFPNRPTTQLSHVGP